MERCNFIKFMLTDIAEMKDNFRYSFLAHKSCDLSGEFARCIQFEIAD